MDYQASNKDDVLMHVLFLITANNKVGHRVTVFSSSGGLYVCLMHLPFLLLLIIK
jgi:hypothetical protein